MQWSQTIGTAPSDFLPLSEIDREIGWSIPWLSGMLTHTTPNGYWKRLDLTEDITELDMPIQHLVGVYDFFSRESVDNFVRMQQHAKNPEVRRQQQLILGPWDHGTIGKSKVGEVDFGPEAELDALGENLAWFNRVLKPDAQVVTNRGPAVRYFSIGDNRWHQADHWPPFQGPPVSFYLRSQGHANTSQGDGLLDRNPAMNDETADTFRADPDDPTPACPITPSRSLFDATWAPVDQRPLEEREDVLVYATAPLEQPLRFAGDVKIELFVSADTLDADWVAKLIDVHPDGFSQNLAVGIQRASFRNNERSPTPIQPGEIYRLLIDLGPIAAKLDSKHKLRVDICGAYFPLFDRNKNTGEGPFGRRTQIANEKVHHGLKYPSRLLLPSVP